MYIDFHDPVDFAAKCQALPLADDEFLLILVGRKSESELDNILEALSATGIRFFGALFPGLIYGGRIKDKGAIVRAYPLMEEPAVADLDSDEITWTRPLPEFSPKVAKPTCLILADFACVSITNLLEDLFDLHGDQVNYFGAGVGNGDRKPHPVVFINNKRFTGSALVAYIERASDVQVRHGWSRISETVIATRTQGNIIKELNWEPAMIVYRRIVGDEVADSLGRSEDVPTAKRYPIGIARDGIEDVVRDPLLGTEHDELVLLSDVPQNSAILVLQGENDRLIEAASELGAYYNVPDTFASCLLFDCFSRAKLLKEDITKELQNFERALKSKLIDCEVEGALALGEIASDGSRLPDFHNKTIAAGVFFDGG